MTSNEFKEEHNEENKKNETVKEKIRLPTAENEEKMIKDQEVERSTVK